MKRSGRLSAAPGSIKVDRGSWWGHVSFALTIVPLAAAAESGAFGDAISILDADDLRRPPMRRAVRAWQRVWCNTDPIIVERLQRREPVHDVLQEGIRRAQWAAHLESLEAVEALYTDAFLALPPGEREFASGWCRVARLFAAAAAHNSLDKVIFPLGGGCSPEQVIGAREGAEGGDPGLEDGALADAEPDRTLAQRKTRRCARSLRWLGKLPGPAFAVLAFLWRRSCVSYPARRSAVRRLHRLCYGGVGGKAAAVTRSIAFMLVPDINYRKMTLPLGIDPVEHVEYDPDYEPPDPDRPAPRPPGAPILNPLQRPWYDGPRPGGRDDGPIENDDDGFGEVPMGLYPLGTEPADLSHAETDEEEGASSTEVVDEDERGQAKVVASRNGTGSSGRSLVS